MTEPSSSALASTLQERLLAVMDAKDHWAWPAFTRAGLSREQLAIHFQHEYQTYVRDFPVLLARVLAHGPPDAVRQALAENIFEEQTGKLSLGVPHPRLFLEMVEALGIDPARVERREGLTDEAIAYRAFLDQSCEASPWLIGAAVMTIFVEGSVHERATLSGERELPPVEAVIARHPMVVHYGCPPDKMRLARAHYMVEGGHRDDAWEMLLAHVDAATSARVEAAVSEALRAWLRYRDGVARTMGLSRKSFE